MRLCLPMLTAGVVASVMVMSACSSPSGKDDAKDSRPKAVQQEARAAGTGGLTSMAAVSSTTCPYNSYSAFGVGEIVSYQGKDTDKYNDGMTKKSDRVLKLMTGKLPDRSAGRLEKTKMSDRGWVNISHDKGKTWKSCGFKTSDKDGDTITSKRYIHSSDTVTNRYMRDSP
ncbi:hypothetical protein [Streptomyces sp. NP-1717]|uniref:hypothetical protein n=1 Tax=Streptomyces sp. NP-1717 TaxID=2704470 RepID=UPI001F5CF849|nr:hypothetical protein [Streptomyces sp. NP-1717]